MTPEATQTCEDALAFLAEGDHRWVADALAPGRDARGRPLHDPRAPGVVATTLCGALLRFAPGQAAAVQAMIAVRAALNVRSLTLWAIMGGQRERALEALRKVVEENR